MSFDSVALGALGVMGAGTMAQHYDAIDAMAQMMGGMGHDGPAWVVS